MANYGIYGPNNIMNNSLKNNAWALVANTINRNWFNSRYRKSHRQYIVMNTNGKLVGFALIGRNKGTDMKLRLIGTVQGRGIGSTLVRQIIANARARGLKTITLETVPEARGFYNKMGFKATSKRNILRYNI